MCDLVQNTFFLGFNLPLCKMDENAHLKFWQLISKQIRLETPGTVFGIHDDSADAIYFLLSEPNMPSGPQWLPLGLHAPWALASTPPSSCDFDLSTWPFITLYSQGNFGTIPAIPFPVAFDPVWPHPLFSVPPRRKYLHMHGESSMAQR